MRIVVGSDECMYLIDWLVEEVKKCGYKVDLFGYFVDYYDYWSVVVQLVVERVVAGEVDEGILFCWIGIGVCLVVNKVFGVCVVLCDDVEIACGVWLWNNVNVFCFFICCVLEVVVKEVIDVWFCIYYEFNKEDDGCFVYLVVIENKYL